MPNSLRNPLEFQLINELQHAETLYQRALKGLQAGVPQPAPAAEDITRCLDRMQPLLSRIQAQESSLAPLREAWMRQACAAGPELKRLLKQHEQVLQSLIEKIDSLEQQLQHHRREAIPGLDRVVKHHQMQRAYQQASR